ncbi:MAG: hypothetical protein HY580_04075 [Nitrospinae bacterium]|nr:hypothetical protein [Nitrospinota bacterium]
MPSNFRLMLSAVSILALIFMVFPVPKGSAFPLGDAFDSKPDDSEIIPGFYSATPGGTTFHKSLNPLMTDGYDEPHPFPEYIKKFGKEEKIPEYYRQLLLLHPQDHVQSKIFDEAAFREMRRIGVLGFENKTYSPYTEPRAGEVVADQVYKELQSVPKYKVISPNEMDQLAFRLKIVSKPPSGAQPEAKKGKEKSSNLEEIPELPFDQKDMDGILIGAVTKFMDTYKDEKGELTQSLSSGVEFGAYLISAKTGNIVWGARFAGSQPVGIVGFFKGEPTSPQWLKKEELSRQAMKKVLRSFHDQQGPVNTTVFPLN